MELLKFRNLDEVVWITKEPYDKYIIHFRRSGEDDIDAPVAELFVKIAMALKSRICEIRAVKTETFVQLLYDMYKTYCCCREEHKDQYTTSSEMVDCASVDAYYMPYSDREIVKELMTLTLKSIMYKEMAGAIIQDNGNEFYLISSPARRAGVYVIRPGGYQRYIDFHMPYKFCYHFIDPLFLSGESYNYDSLFDYFVDLEHTNKYDTMEEAIQNIDFDWAARHYPSVWPVIINAERNKALFNEEEN